MCVRALRRRWCSPRPGDGILWSTRDWQNAAGVSYSYPFIIYSVTELLVCAIIHGFAECRLLAVYKSLLAMEASRAKLSTLVTPRSEHSTWLASCLCLLFVLTLPTPPHLVLRRHRRQLHARTHVGNCRGVGDACQPTTSGHGRGGYQS